MSSIYGEFLKLSIFGQSHGPAVGMSLDGIPAGFPVDFVQLQRFLDRRAPGKNTYSTSRQEVDRPEFLSGILDGFTCGAPLTAVIYNQDTRSGDYDALRDIPRPGHADFPADVKYGGFQDTAGGGHFSGRLTAPLCIAGGLCIQWLALRNIRVAAHILSIADVRDEPFDPLAPNMDAVGSDFPVLSDEAGKKMRARINAAAEALDSVGGIIECAVTGLPAGLGEPMFGGVESRISSIVYGIPAVKCVGFGAGERAAALRGTENNDAFILEDGVIRTRTNHCGGILGGITDGMPLIFTAAFKPTPSIGLPQQSVSLHALEPRVLTVKGRHDPCIVPRAVPAVEAAAAIAVFDMFLGNTQTDRRKNIDGLK